MREIARELDASRNTVRRYLKSPEAMRPKARPPRGSNLDPYTEHVEWRMAEGLENCRVLNREIRALGYQGSYSTVVQYVRPRRRRRQPEATMRFETEPGEQAQVDWGSLSYIGADGKQAPRLGVRDDAGLVAGLLRGTGAQGGHRGLHPVPRQCLRVSGRRAPPVPLRQCQGGHAGPRRREATDLEPADAGFRLARGF